MKFAGIHLDEPRVMGVINVSPESFYKGSVRNDEKALAETAVRMVEEGASFIDIGAKSTAPYLETQIPLEEEIRRAVWAVKVVKDAVDVPVSIDTTSAKVAEEALKAGADIINDVTGFKGDPEMAKVASEYSAPAVLCAHGNVRNFSDPVRTVIEFLEESLTIAEEHGVEDVAVDPAIGFLRPEWPPWYEWDSKVIANLNLLKLLGKPILVGISRKSFIGAITGRKDPSERLAGSLSATAIAVLKGARIVRAHDVRETLDAIKVAEFIGRFST
ncbi:Dihydropteroate synthase-related enzyme [Thermococcus nautili]|uniref:dihydropteroate synthase n=1 Tax=Thermococcus nautili TaxID=195522 RepID=UPI002556D8C4|nr:dihydropteroate synthase [Thermococcus nautili]CAI1494008.1 Dihydropteroate synthase-related enzyme [Thermococcus nautili]